MAGASGAALFLNRTDHRETARGARWLPSRRRDGGGQRPLGVDRAATAEPIALAPHRDESGDGIDVAHEQDLTRPAPPEGNDIAYLVTPGGEAHGTEPRNQPLAKRSLLGRRARDREHLLQ